MFAVRVGGSGSASASSSASASGSGAGVVHVHLGDCRAEPALVEDALGRIARAFPGARLGTLYLDTT